MDSAAIRSSGIYALFNLDGAPLDPAEAAALGMPAGAAPQSWQVDAVDTHAPGAVHRHVDTAATTVVVGEIEDTAGLAARLGLARATPTALIARAALERFGSDTPAEMVGEWSLVAWECGVKLTLMTSAARRDRVHYAITGSRVALAPNLFALGKIGWIGTGLDEAGLLFQLGRAGVRSAVGDRTMLARVRQLGPGGSLVISVGGECRKGATAVLAGQPRRTGSFEDAVAEAEQLLRQIMRERLARTPRAAPLLSGGLDSSLLTWLVAQAQGDGPPPLCITSVAPPGSGLPDEAAFADLVAAHLGLPCLHVAPPEAANSFRPMEAIFAGANGPPLSNRHCLTEAFQVAARQAGATLLINGTYGEMTATARLPARAIKQRLRAIAVRILRAARPAAANAVPIRPFHVRLAAHRLVALPEPVREATARPIAQPGLPDGDELLGYLPGVEKALAHANEFYAGALRMDFPFRDVRLLRLFAGIPVRTLLEGGHDRPVARRMLAGHLPDAIRLRRSGMPASPDHYARLRRQAPAARSRIAAFRKAGVDDWLDLDWLDAALGRIGQRGAAGVDEANEVQLTAIAAEFLTWWRARS